MFCDTIYEFYNNKNARHISELSRAIEKDIIPNFPAYPKFVISEHFKETILEFLKDESFINSILSLARLPHDPMWLEWSQGGVKQGFVLSNSIDESIYCIGFCQIEQNKLSSLEMNFYPQTIKHENGAFIINAQTNQDSSFSDQIVVSCSMIICGILTAINSKTIIEDKPPDLGRINVKRQSNGKHPLFDHHFIQIKKEIRDAMKAPPPAGDEHHKLHWVRGHWKHRKTGVFWWKPFLAGKGGGEADTPSYTA